jgi:hypothetical protein
MKLWKLLGALALVPGLAMAQTQNISRTDVALSGLNLTTTYQNAPGVIYFPNDGKTLLSLQNTSGGAVTATVVTKATSMSRDGFGSVTLSNQTVSVPNNARMLVGPFPVIRWNQSGSLVQVSMSSVTGVSATAVRVAQ